MKNKHAGSSFKKHYANQLTNRAARARHLETIVGDYLDTPSKLLRDEFDQLVLDCAKAIRAGKGKRK